MSAQPWTGLVRVDAEAADGLLHDVALDSVLPAQGIEGSHHHVVAVDLDGKVDCDDADCIETDICSPAEICDDGTDNDGDGLVDCQDPDCPATPVETDCADGKDEDCDGPVDCADCDCVGDPACPTCDVLKKRGS